MDTDITQRVLSAAIRDIQTALECCKQAHSDLQRWMNAFTGLTDR